MRTLESLISLPPSLLLFLLTLPTSDAWIRKEFSIPGPYVIYKTEPTFTPIKTEVTHYSDDRSKIQPGYTLIAPHIDTLGWGPHIFDEDGELVWYGASTVSKMQGHYTYAMNFHVCDYLGERGNHLCYSEARPHTEDNDAGIKAVGANRIFNNNYEQVGRDYQAIGDFPEPNPHEFIVFKGGESFAQSVYFPRKLDLRDYAGDEDGWLLEGCIQEASLPGGEELFKWCSLDDQPVWHTDIFLKVDGNTVNKSTPIGGAGKEGNKWDNIHLNAIDKDEEGNYVISGRHWDQIVKVAGPNNTHGRKPGEMIWKLGGKYSDFEIDAEARFTRQHDIRVVKTTATEQWISLFDNAFDGHTEPSAEYSSMKILRLDNRTMRASLGHVYNHPKRRLAYAQGSGRILENGNVYVGWGGIPEWSEFTEEGTLLSHSRAISDEQEKLENYRSLKFSWVGHPLTSPKILAYCRTCEILSGEDTDDDGTLDTGSPLVVYASWNGATEVKSWRFSASVGNHLGPWFDAGTYPKKGFETKVRLSGAVLNRLKFTPYVQVEALDAHGKILGTSYNKTFVPRPKLSQRCGTESCFKPERFVYEEAFSQARHCGLSYYRYVPAVFVLFCILFMIESVERYLFQEYLQGLVQFGTRMHKGTIPLHFDASGAVKEI